MTAKMTVSELRQFTLKNNFDTISINGKSKSEYDARQYLFKIPDQQEIFNVSVQDEILCLVVAKSVDV